MIPGDPDEDIVVVLPSIWDLLRFIVPIPVKVLLESPTTTVFIAPVVAIPTAVGIKSTFRLVPSIYAWYVPRPVSEYSPILVDNLPYSNNSMSDPLWTTFNSTASNSSFLEMSGLILTKTFALEYVCPIETIVLVVFDGISILSVSIRTTPPRLVLPVPSTTSSKLYESVETS